MGDDDGVTAMTMIDHGDVPLDTDRATLLALTDAVAAIALDASRGEDGGHGVWLRLRDGQCLQMGSGCVNPAFKFEVFPLAIGGIEELRQRMAGLGWMPEEVMRSMPEEFGGTLPYSPWPQGAWTLEVVQRRDWIADPALMSPDEFEMGRNLPPGVVPQGTEHACLVALGLLFSFADGDRLLIATADWPPATLTTSYDPERIDAFLEPCFRIDARRYAETM